MITRETMSGELAAHELDALAARARAGERDGADALLREIRPLVYRWAWIRTADADDADDVTQIVLVRVHERIVDFEGRSSFTSWLYRITANAAGELHRRRSVMRRLADRLRGRARTEPAAGDPLERIESLRIRDIVSRILETMPERQRVAFDLVDLQGFTPAEAADMLESNATTLRVHLLRARRTIRSRIIGVASRNEEPESNA
jgi:RNA polymerase sigma-70 factor (ECF subfamily)